MNSPQAPELASYSIEDLASGASWAAIAAGAVAASALTLVLLAFGAGMGFSAVSPWSSSGASVTTFSVIAGIYLLVAATLASSIGGYLAGRLRTKWVDLHTHEVYFRDTAHGFLAWAFATIISASLLAAAAAYIAGGASAGGPQAAGSGASQSPGNPASYFVDELFRPSNPTATNDENAAVKGEAARIILRGLAGEGDIPAADRTYLAQVVAARTGVSPQDAEKRVSEVIARAKMAADQARKAAGQLSLWLTASMLLGAFAASLAATEGGQLRDRDQATL
jgi:hypothetical protein